MASSTDTWLRVVIGVAIVLAVASAPRRETTPPLPSGTATPAATVSPVPARPVPSTNIPGGTLVSCTGESIATATADVGERGGLILQVFYSTYNGGRNCAMVSKTGTAGKLPGELVTTLQFHNYDGRRWPRYATQRSTAGYRSDGIYLDRTNDRCVRAWARFTPDRGRAVTVDTGKVGCR